MPCFCNPTGDFVCTACLELREAMDAKLAELRERWLDVPWNGVVEKGTAGWLQPLINAVSAIVDPDRTLRETPEAKRRGMIAEYRSKYARFAEQVKLAQGMLDKFGLAHAEDLISWEQKRDEIGATCLAEFGIDLATEAR